MSDIHHLTDAELEQIEDDVQHDVAVWRELRAEQGDDRDANDIEDDDVVGRLDRIEKYICIE